MQNLDIAFIAVLVASLNASATGVDYFIKDGMTDWTSASSYWNDAIPGEGDYVVISNKTTATLNMSTDVGSVEIVNKLAGIRPMYNLSTFVCVVTGTDEKTLNPPIYNPAGSINGFWGEFVKRGTGTLTLASYTKHLSGNFVYDYKVGKMTVEEGTLKWPQNVPKREQQYGNVHIEEGATLVATLFDTTQGGTMAYYVNGTLTGGGTFSNPSSGARQLRVYINSEFSGKLMGPFQLFVSGEWNLTGTGSTIWVTPMVWSLAAPAKPGVIGVKKFGMKADAESSIGTTSDFMIDYRGGGYRYLGGGNETTDKELKISASTVNPASMDGGTDGGLTFSGSWYMNGTPNQMHELVLKGANATACVLANNLSHWTANGYPYDFQVVKYGTGIWRFADYASRSWAGAMHVREGTVQFDSIAEKGEPCALGYATNTAAPYMGVYDVSKEVSYAVSLGGLNESSEASAGILEYTGTNNAVCTTRLIVIDGLGGTLKASAGELALAGVSGLGTGERTLTLDGAAGTTNYLRNVTDGDSATVSLVKDGAGAWILTGEQSFSGDLVVSNGTLSVETVSEKYTWYRFTVKRVANGQAYVHTHELGFYDETGAQRFMNPTCREPIPRSSNTWVWCSADYRTLKPGEVMFGKSGYYKNTWYSPSDFRDFYRLFDGVAGTNQPGFDLYYGGSDPSVTNNLSIDPVMPATWVSFVMRLAADTPSIVAYDIYRGSTYGGQWRPQYFTLEGSRDGVYWKTLHTSKEGASADKSTDQHQWMSDGSEFVSGAYRPGTGWPIASCETGGESQLENVRSVSVASGAKLVSDGSHVVSALRLNASDNGTISGIRLAASGTLDVTGLGQANETVLGTVFENVSTLGNVLNWTLTEGGEESYKKIAVNDDKIKIVRSGTIISIK